MDDHLQAVTQEKDSLKQQLFGLQRQILNDHGIQSHLSTDIKMQRVYEQLAKVATTTANVLISGETGVGKELMAKLVHSQSLRRAQKFVAINCAAIPENLLESELFGYVKGAFTGADGNKPGKLEVANNGTLFLDEIGSVPRHTQTKLLRVLQERTIERLGSTKSQRINVRLITATNDDLQELIRAGVFRADFYYRISTFPIRIPPLRERRSDIPLLAEFFLKRLATTFDNTITGIRDEVIEALMLYDWPGNVRELENVLERAVILEENNELTLDSLPPEFLTPLLIKKNITVENQYTLKEARKRVINKFEKEYLSSLADKYQYDLKQVALHAGVSLRYVQMKIKEYELPAKKQQKQNAHSNL